MEKDLLTSELFAELKRRLAPFLERLPADAAQVVVKTRGLSPEEAIGTPQRRDYPLQAGKEVMLEAECAGARGQAFTDAPADCSCDLQAILALDPALPHNRGLIAAVQNAVLRALGEVEHTIHCKNDEPERCAAHLLSFLKARYTVQRLALVGYQPAFLACLAAHFQVRVLDLHPANVGQTRFGVRIEHGERDFAAVSAWAELILCTGSTLCNGTMPRFLNLAQEKDVLFFGVSAAAACRLLGLKRFCSLGG